jgi:hypothetical protein
MPRRELLTAAQREALLAFPEEEENLEWLALPEELGRDIHQNHVLRLARQGAQTPANDLLAESAPLLRSPQALLLTNDVQKRSGSAIPGLREAWL